MARPKDTQLLDLGRKCAPAEIALLFEVEESTLKRQYARYGGVMLGRKPLFFEKLVSEAVRRHYATQAQDQRDMDREMARSSQEGRGASSPTLHFQGRSESLGSRDEATVAGPGDAERHDDPNRHDLLD